jgi:hypothetical protein
MLKKIVCIISAFVFIAALGGCGSKNNDSSSAKKQPTQQEEKVEWNTKELNPFKNGNFQKAVKVMKGKNLSSLAMNANAENVMKRPWDYYGKVIRFNGEVGLVEDQPTGSKIGKIIGGPCTEIIIVDNKSDTIIDIICKGTSGNLQEGQQATLVAYPVGRMEIKNSMGGYYTHLIGVGELQK